MQKIIVGLLVLTVLGAVAVGLYDASQSNKPVDANQLLALETDQTAPVQQSMSATQTPTVETPVPPATPTVAPVQPIQQQQASSQIGEPWQDSGMIAAFDTNGMFLTGTTSGEIYVELGPSMFWQQQPVSLAVGETVSVDGFYNGEQYHAVSVSKTDGTQLAVRTADGLPLWSGGANNSNGNGGQGQQAGGDAVLVAPDEWVTIEGVVTVASGNALTMQTVNAETINLQLGQRSFVDTQHITFAVGDEITVLGYWQGTQFKAGEITNVQTGERLMLLDPNGRPLWGGPGRNGEQGQGGNGNAGGGNSTGGSGNSGNAGNAGGGGGGNGNGYQGGRNQAQAELSQ